MEGRKGDYIRLLGKPADSLPVGDFEVLGRHFECGIVNNGIEFIDSTGYKMCEYDGAYEVVTRRTRNGKYKLMISASKKNIKMKPNRVTRDTYVYTTPYNENLSWDKKLESFMVAEMKRPRKRNLDINKLMQSIEDMYHTSKPTRPNAKQESTREGLLNMSIQTLALLQLQSDNSTNREAHESL